MGSVNSVHTHHCHRHIVDIMDIAALVLITFILLVYLMTRGKKSKPVVYTVAKRTDSAYTPSKPMVTVPENVMPPYNERGVFVDTKKCPECKSISSVYHSGRYNKHKNNCPICSAPCESNGKMIWNMKDSIWESSSEILKKMRECE